MAIPPIKSEHIVSTEHFITGVTEEFLDHADFKHFLDVHFFEPPKQFPIADKSSLHTLGSVGRNVEPSSKEDSDGDPAPVPVTV